MHTSWAAAGDLADVAPRAKQGNQSPLYFYQTWALARWFGQNEFVLRFPSLAAGIALVPLSYGLALALSTSRGAALLAAVLAALDRDFIYYSQEARPYAMVQLLALTQAGIFWRLVAADSAAARHAQSASGAQRAAWRMAFVFTTALLLSLHYTAVLMLCGEIAFFAWSATRPVSSGYKWIDFVLDLLLALFFCLPLVFHAADVFRRRALWGQFVSATPTPLMARLGLVYVAWPLAFVAAVYLARRLANLAPRLARVDARALALVACWLALPVVAAWLTTFFEAIPLLLTRYLISSATALPLCAALCFASLPARLGKSLMALGVVGASLASSGMGERFLADGRLLADRDEDWHGAVAHIEREDAAGDLPVLLCPGLIEDEFLRESSEEGLVEYCSFPFLGIYRFASRERGVFPLPTQSPSQPSVAAREAIQAAGGAWLVVRGSSALWERAASEIRTEIGAAEIAHVRSRRDFGGVQVGRLALGSAEDDGE